MVGNVMLSSLEKNMYPSPLFVVIVSHCLQLDIVCIALSLEIKLKEDNNNTWRDLKMIQSIQNAYARIEKGLGRWQSSSEKISDRIELIVFISHEFEEASGP